MSSRQTRLIVVKKVSTLNDIKPDSNDNVCLIIPSVKHIYNVLDRPNTRIVTIGDAAFSEMVSVKLYQKYIRKFQLKHMILVENTNLLENDIIHIIKTLDPDDIIRVD